METNRRSVVNIAIASTLLALIAEVASLIPILEERGIAYLNVIPLWKFLPFFGVAWGVAFLVVALVLRPAFLRSKRYSEFLKTMKKET